jgi:glycosyltransferase involved in cell wall biosynthesis
MSISALARRLLPGHMRERLHVQRQRWKAWRYRSMLARRRLEVPRDGIHVSYGDVLPREAGAIVSGGRVKLTLLESRFPALDGAFNVLYLVSSAQPPFSLEYAQWAKSHGARLVWNQNGVAYPGWAGGGDEAINAPMREVRAIADYVIYQSEFCRESADRFLGPVSAPFEVLYNCVDLQRFRPADNLLPPEPWRLLAAGSHLQAERVWSVLETVAVLRRRGRDARLILAGRLGWPDGERQTQAAIREFGIDDVVDLVPPFTQQEAPSLYQSAHVLLHTKYKDPCPTVVIEALACGLPVIGSRSGGMVELVGDECGVLLDVPQTWEAMPVPNADELADAVETVMARLDEYRRRARARATERFDKDTWVERHAAIFASVLGRS